MVKKDVQEHKEIVERDIVVGSELVKSSSKQEDKSS